MESSRKRLDDFQNRLAYLDSEFLFRVWSKFLLDQLPDGDHLPFDDIDVLVKIFEEKHNGKWINIGGVTYFVFDSKEDLTVFCLKNEI